MREAIFVREVVDALGHAGAWVYKIPDMPVGFRETRAAKEAAAAVRAWAATQPNPPISALASLGSQRVRFNPIRPCDLIAVTPSGQAMLIEVKMARARTFVLDERAVKQCVALIDVEERFHAKAYLMVNWRFYGKRPDIGPVNRAFCIVPKHALHCGRLRLPLGQEEAEPWIASAHEMRRVGKRQGYPPGIHWEIPPLW